MLGGWPRGCLLLLHGKNFKGDEEDESSIVITEIKNSITDRMNQWLNDKSKDYFYCVGFNYPILIHNFTALLQIEFSESKDFSQVLL